VQIADNMPLGDWPDGELRALSDRARALGIQLEAGTRGIEPETLSRYLEVALLLNSPILRTLIDSPGRQPSPEQALNELAASMPAFERAGVVLAIENHDRFKARTLHRIVEQVSSSHLGVCLDTANSLGCGEGIDQVLDTLAGIVVNLHVKDFVTRRLPHNKGFVVEGAPAGKGLLDIPAILARLPRDISAIVELWPPPEDDIEASVAKEHAWAAESVRYMRGVTGCI
jgi:sugar phosphate isomerase/epimerase